MNGLSSFGTALHAPLLISAPSGGVAKATADYRVLVADDDPGMRSILQLCLSRAGYGVTAVADGEAAWAAFTVGSYDLLVTDHDMPKLLGLDLIRRLRSLSHRLPIIFMSGSMPWHTTDLKGVLRPGITLEKPFHAAVLVAHVQALLAKASLTLVEREPTATDQERRAAERRELI